MGMVTGPAEMGPENSHVHAWGSVKKSLISWEPKVPPAKLAPQK